MAAITDTKGWVKQTEASVLRAGHLRWREIIERW